MHSTRTTIIVLLFGILFFACGSSKEDEKEAQRKVDLLKLSEQMNHSLITLNVLKEQLEDSLGTYYGVEDSLAKVKSDKFQLLLAEVEKAEETFRSWQQEIEYEPENMKHEDAMQYYQHEEEKAATIRQHIEKTIEYVRDELGKS